MEKVFSKAIQVFACSLACLMTSCVKELEAPEPEMNALPVFKEMSFEAVSGEDEAQTRTIRNDDGSLSWLPGDEINIFYGNRTSGRFISDNTEPAARTTFTGHFSQDPDGSQQYYWAVYPYMSTNGCDGSRLTLSVPSVQVSSPGTFGPGMFPSVARSKTTTLAFYNVCGVIKFSLSRSDIDQVTLSGNGDEVLAGSVRVTFGNDGKPVAEAQEGSTAITLRPDNGGCFERGKYYYMSVLPGTLSRGFTMTFHTEGGEEGTLVNNNPVTIKRSIAGKKDNIDSYVSSWHDSAQDQDFSDTGIYLGILAFNQALYSYPVSLLTSETIGSCESFVDGLQMKNGTILYYAADNGLMNMQQGESPRSLAGASLVTFTDGLDQGSLMMNPDYGTEDKYLTAVSNRIRNGNVFGQPLSAFSIGIRGNDVQNTSKFKENLVKLASSDQNAYEISNMSELEAKFYDIADIASVSVEYSHDVSLTIPGLPDGTKVRFTFDDVSSASASSIYIEGTFNLRSRMLTNVSYKGLTSASGSSVAGTVNDIFVKFNFRKVRRNDGRELSAGNIRQWQSVAGSSSWQKNSEFDSAADTDIAVSVSRKSAIVYLVLDCSSSLGDQFGTMKDKVKKFIRKLYNDSYIETGVNGIRVSTSETSIQKGQTMKLTATVYPATALNKEVRWSSDNNGVATVDNNGVVTGVSSGSTYIYAESVDGGYRASCRISVFELPESSQGQSSFTQSGLYLGVLAFNQGLYRYPITRLTEENVEAICSFIENNPTRNGSLVYYAADEAVSDIKAPAYPSDLSDAALVTFTDVLDQGSLMKKSYTTNDQYLSAVKQRIDGTRVGACPLTAYSIGIRGSDVEDIQGYKANLQKLASSPDNAYEITNISSLEGKLNDIAQVLSVERTYSYSCTVTIPGVGNGTRIRFTFDNVSSASQSGLYIEGTFNLSSKALTNVVYYGFSSGAGTTVSGTVDGIFVTYTFKGLRKSDGTQLSTGYMKEWLSDSSQSTWQINSEFDNSNDASTEVSVDRKSAVIYLVLDYSTSIGSKSSSMKSAAKNFVRNLQQKSYDPYAVSSVRLDKTSWRTVPGMTVKLTATISPDTALDKTVSWYSSNPSVASVNQEGVVTSHQTGTAIITVTTQDGGLTATCTVTVKDSLGDAVDLGLSVKWATFNIGATRPEEYGDYFAWGETEPYYSSQDPLTWKDGKSSGYYWPSYKWCNGSFDTQTKYNTISGYGTVDNKTVLDPEDDAAHVNWGGSWRMPTMEECDELINKCTWTWTTQNGVNGRLVTGPNGKSIFLPAAGYRLDTYLHYAGSWGYYWSSSLPTDLPYYACYVNFNSDYVYWSDLYRYFGQSVRPVSEYSSQERPVESVSIDKTTLNLLVGATAILTMSVYPNNAANKSVTWTSSNPSVASVDQSGKVTAVGLGKSFITVTTIDGAKTASCEVTVKELASDGYENGYGYVDLGLPSGLKWATMNVGASAPEEYGEYFAWGETQPKSSFTWNSYIWCKGSQSTLTKYCFMSSSGYKGFTDNKKVLDPEDDAAHVNWGVSWRMPTAAECDELINTCTWTWATLNGVNGRLVTGPNGNTLFLPAAGRNKNDEKGGHGYYWSSSLISETPTGAWRIDFDSSNVKRRGNYVRAQGFTIRPVTE